MILSGLAHGAESDERNPRAVTGTEITSFEQIWSMTEAETKEWHRLRMEYVVYYYDPLWKALWGRSGEADSYLSVGSKPFPIKPRQRILVEGLIMPVRGMIVEEPKVTVLAENAPVEILSTSGDVANTQRFNKRLVTVDGYVERQSARDANHHELDLIVEGRSMLVQFLVRSGETVPQMKGSLVRVHGLYFARNEPTWPEPKLELWVPGIQSFELRGQVERDERFNLPATPVKNLAAMPPGRLVRVVGLVQAQQPGKTMTLSDESGRLSFPTAQSQPIPVNGPVEAVGLTELRNGEPTLQQAFYRQEIATITRYAEIEQMSEAKRNQIHRVKLDFTVHYFDPYWKILWGRCASENSYLSLADQPFPIKQGQRILIEGLIVPAKGMGIEEPRISLLAESTPLEVLPIAGQVGNTERFGGQLISVEGYVDQLGRPDAHHTQVFLVAEGRALTLQVLHDEKNPVTYLEGALLQVQGVYSATYDSTNLLPKLEVWVQGQHDIAIKGSIEQNKQFDRPVTSIEQVESVAPDQLIRVAGAVRAQQPGKSLTIRDETGQLTLMTAQSRRLQLGEHVEAVGFVQRDGAEWRLRDSLYRPATVKASPAVSGQHTLRLAEQLRELPPDEAARGLPVQLNGIVTWSNPNADFFFVHDATGGVCVFQPAEMKDEIGRGSKVTLNGVSASGKFSPVVLASTVLVAARVELPPAKQITLEQALTGVEEAQWVTMSGYVRNVTHDGPWARLHLTTSAGEFDALLPWSENLKRLRHSVVRMRGVCSALTNAKRQLTGIQLWLGSERYLEIEEAEPADPFTVAAQTISGLRQYNTLQATNRRVRVAGVVLHQTPGHRLLIQDGAESLLVLSEETMPLTPGDRIEAVGFPGRENNRVVLREAVYRRLSAGVEPQPQPLSSLRPINVELDGRLVSIQANLLERFSQGSDSRLILQVGEMIFEATLDSQKTPSPKGWEEGSRLALTGIYQVQFDEYKRPHDVHLLLRSAQDVQLISRPSWLTLGRALIATGVLAVGILLGFVWVVALRRRVQRQTGQIREQIESEKAARLEIALARASKLESLGVLAGGIAHDFNNLLTVVMGNLSLAKLDPRIDPETKECLREGEKAAQRARDLTQQLITFAKGGEPVRTVGHLAEIVRDSTRFALHGSKVRCEYDFATDAWAAEIDKGQIGQVVHNLIINATHAMPEGGVVRINLRNEEIVLGAHASLKPGRYLRLTIADTGSGIGPEYLPRIFDPYFTTKTKGSGLGLASVYSIIKKHHGHIEVESALGIGTTFFIWLPAESSGQSESARAEAKQRSARPARVLLMDDEASIRQLGGAIFKRLGLDHTAVADGAAVLREYETARANGCPYDLVMLDLTVPGGMGGAEAMAKLRQMDPQVRAIVSSGYSEDPVMANYRAYGFMGVIPKPYVMEEFLKTITPILPQKLAHD